tara:strand:- start:944 stop:1468 length:525 start_codon:yes stop_codon:yes gene_type:complete
MNKFIKCYEDILDNKICENIIKNLTVSNFEKATVSRDEINFKTRRCFQKPLKPEFDEDVFKAVGKVLERYVSDIPFLDTLKYEDSGYTHLLYREKDKGEYIYHVDDSKYLTRTLSCSIILNDNFEGGCFSFLNNKQVIKPIQGSAIIFPSNFCFPHAITPVTKGNRHSIITWII